VPCARSRTCGLDQHVVPSSRQPDEINRICHVYPFLVDDDRNVPIAPATLDGVAGDERDDGGAVGQPFFRARTASSVYTNFLAGAFMNSTCLSRAALAVACVLCVTGASAQSAQAHSVQASVLATSIRFNGSNASGVGFEGQFRFNRVHESERGVLSLGLGVQSTSHQFTGSKMTIVGAFAEPRYMFAGSSEKFFPYLSARLAVLRQSSATLSSTTGGAAGGGAGFGYKLSKRVNLDFGASLLVQTFGEAAVVGSSQRYKFSPFLGYAAKAGLSLGL
jgi:hypothetical protein